MRQHREDVGRIDGHGTANERQGGRKERMARSNGGLSWSEQWGGSRSSDGVGAGGNAGGGQFGSSGPKKSSSKSGGGKKIEDAMAKAKVVASAGAEKARVAAGIGASKAKIGALKVKSGAVTGFKWVKEQYSKRTTKK
ncbi:serine, glycine and glutamine-rich protein-like [Selaginella moellendorffii]|uniref:serine, glycine and glutamine-rich protein-like n=1 Tax=Selaginella moellendorffii TaxID=88036 RepID=UPI000D1C8651|nr:serine, glycine and glutamine-rich protein-like [Selaginella moellendorffii]|eukprot:XP_024517633.1 serine, glycine and glutamine-rich protein-like [Selaginella moellendorffii]